MSFVVWRSRPRKMTTTGPVGRTGVVLKGTAWKRQKLDPLRNGAATERPAASTMLLPGVIWHLWPARVVPQHFMRAVDALDQHCLSECTAREFVKGCTTRAVWGNFNFNLAMPLVVRIAISRTVWLLFRQHIYSQSHRYFTRARAGYPSRSSLISDIMLIACSSLFGICGTT